MALCSRSTPQGYLDYLKTEGVAYIQCGKDKVDLHAALRELNALYGVNSVRVDSGGILNGALLRAGLVDDLAALRGDQAMLNLRGGWALTWLVQVGGVDPGDGCILSWAAALRPRAQLDSDR
jgi:hypothetical protein